MAPLTSLVMFLTTCLATTTLADSITDGTELVFAFMVHRHGDRTPETSTLTFVGNSVNATLAEEMTLSYGYGQLTEVGMRTGYKVGEFIRRRYDELIAPYYNSSELYLRSTDVTRVKMTALTSMSAVFPSSVNNWSDEINWTPVPYTTVPSEYDFNVPASSCPNYVTPYILSYFSSSERMEPYAELIQKVSNMTGVDITSLPNIISIVYDVYVCLDSMGYNLSEEILTLMPQLKKANDEVWDIIYGADNYLSYAAGPMLYEFFEYANMTIAGEDTPSVRIYAGHDANVYPMVAITQVEERQGAPKFAALYALELRKVTSTGKYAVLPVYLDDPKVGEEKYLQIKGCNGEYLCDYDEFWSLTSANAIDEASWRTLCGSS